MLAEQLPPPIVNDAPCIKKPVSINGVTYPSIRWAAQELNIPRMEIKYRLKSDRYPTYFYINPEHND